MGSVIDFEKHATFAWSPPPMAGRVVSIVGWRNDVVIACEYRIYLMTMDEQGHPVIHVAEEGEL